MTTDAVPRLRYTPDEFVDASKKGDFGDRRRVQLIEGEVWESGPIGPWHGQATARTIHLLHRPDVLVTTQTLPMPGSMPDPDVWVLRSGAVRTGAVRGYSTWAPSDVLLVVEVSDATRTADMTKKAQMYAAGGVLHYWVVTPDRLYAFSQPRAEVEGGYRMIETFTSLETVALPYGAGEPLSVSELIG